jgi:hypothetical protein
MEYTERFPNEGFICPVVCVGLTFMGEVRRTNEGGSIRLTFHVLGDNTRDNRQYNEFMRGRKVDA